uniref:T-cell activation inhibitor, mitochondrial n=1 Tax=Glossina austeni TaxID=7395 RepID=A0A1A9UL86_GLOAU
MLWNRFVVGLRSHILIQMWHPIYNYGCLRCISTELASALRPFYFAVHPDLFGQHPKQRTVNEDSLKQLNAHIEILYEGKYHALREAKTLKFYIRVENAENRDTFKLITITLDNRLRDPKVIIQKLLELCSLPTDYVKRIKDSAGFSATTTEFKPGRDYNYGPGFMDFEVHFREAKFENETTLEKWIGENAILAKGRAQDLIPLIEEVEKLRVELIERFGLKDARFDCGWNFEHFRGCLKTLERLEKMHAKHMKNLRGRIVVFAPFTGISLEGHVMLYTGDVLNNWIEFIKNIPVHDGFVKQIPVYENTLSQVLRKIKIGRRKFMPKQQAREYASHLIKVTTTIGDYLSRNKFPKNWPTSLNGYEIVVESEAGPLMVSPTGQLIVPAACPGFMLVDFITNNLDTAEELMKKYAYEKHIERELTQQCIEQLKLKNLTKEDLITPDKMIKTLTALLRYKSAQFEGLNLNISNYYSVLTDGVVCIPWDFNTR